jgi:putative ABC transport system ATP-binding protein
MAFIEIKDLTKEYVSTSKPVLALRGLNLNVDENEICTIMGPSGCGKSTLLNILGGIDEPTSGYARVGNFTMMSQNTPIFRNIFNSDELTNYRRYNVGFIFQFHNLSPVHTALENVELPMIFTRVPKAERKKRAIELLEEVGLGKRASHRPDELSGGERQRVAVATAFANNPSLILADEPTGELDQENSDLICDLILRLKKQRNFSMILVTHNPIVAKMGDKIYNMKDGIIRGSIQKSVLNNMADFSIDENLEAKQGKTEFPPKFCNSCGSPNIMIPKFDTKTGYWIETQNYKRFSFEFEFAQCSKCAKIFWNTKTIE